VEGNLAALSSFRVQRWSCERGGFTAFCGLLPRRVLQTRTYRQARIVHHVVLTTGKFQCRGATGCDLETSKLGERTIHPQIGRTAGCEDPGGRSSKRVAATTVAWSGIFSENKLAAFCSPLPKGFCGTRLWSKVVCQQSTRRGYAVRLSSRYTVLAWRMRHCVSVTSLRGAT
jgi:hypothetical protein